MSKRRSNKSVKRMMVDVYKCKLPDENFSWEYFNNAISNHFGELVMWTDGFDYPDTVYYGTQISLTASELKGGVMDNQEANNKQVEALRSMYEFHALLISMSEDEVKIFCEHNKRLIQNLIDQLSC